MQTVSLIIPVIKQVIKQFYFPGCKQRFKVHTYLSCLLKKSSGVHFRARKKQTEALTEEATEGVFLESIIFLESPDETV